jgi:hypothetical protein
VVRTTRLNPETTWQLLQAHDFFKCYRQVKDWQLCVCFRERVMFLSYWLVDVLTLCGCDKSSRLRALVRSCIVTSETGSGDGDEDSPEDQEFVCKSKTFASQDGQLLSWKETFVLAPSPLIAITLSCCQVCLSCSDVR